MITHIFHIFLISMENGKLHINVHPYNSPQDIRIMKQKKKCFSHFYLQVHVVKTFSEIILNH